MSTVDDDFDDSAEAPDRLPSLQHLLAGASPLRAVPREAPPLDEYTYLDVSCYLTPGDVQIAERAFMEHMEACEEYEMDGCEPPAPYCGCSDCFYRAAAGFWISYIMDAIRRGAASAEEPPSAVQLEFGTELPA